MAVFVTDMGLDIMARTNVLAMDGTFRTCPDPFFQLYVIQVSSGRIRSGTGIFKQILIEFCVKKRSWLEFFNIQHKSFSCTVN